MEIRFGQQAGLRLVTVRQLCETPGYEWATESSIRHLIFSAEPRFASSGEVLPGNGLAEAGAVIRLGRKLLIDLNAFDKWIDAHRIANPSQLGGG